MEVETDCFKGNENRLSLSATAYFTFLYIRELLLQILIQPAEELAVPDD